MRVLLALSCVGSPPAEVIFVVVQALGGALFLLSRANLLLGAAFVPEPRSLWDALL